MLGLMAVVFGGFFLLVAVLAWKVLPQRAKLASQLSRDRIAGSVLMFAAVAWLAFAAIEMIGLDSESKLRLAILLLVPVLTVLFASTLDFLVARALGGLLLLTCARLIDLAGWIQMPGRSSFSAVCYMVSIAGFVLIIAPWLLRDLLEKCSARSAWRWSTAVPALLTGLFFVVYGAVCFSLQNPHGQ
jgi:hypothetical protein